MLKEVKVKLDRRLVNLFVGTGEIDPPPKKTKTK